MSSYLLNKETAEWAVRMALPFIELLMKTYGREDLHIVVLEPLSGVILYEHSFGDPELWKLRHDAHARSMAEVAWRTKADTIYTQNHMPWMFKRADVLLGGGVYRDGLVVAVAGFPPPAWYFNQMIAEVIAVVLKGRCIDEIEPWRVDKTSL